MERHPLKLDLENAPLRKIIDKKNKVRYNDKNDIYYGNQLTAEVLVPLRFFRAKCTGTEII